MHSRVPEAKLHRRSQRRANLQSLNKTGAQFTVMKTFALLFLGCRVVAGRLPSLSFPCNPDQGCRFSNICEFVPGTDNDYFCVSPPNESRNLLLNIGDACAFGPNEPMCRGGLVCDADAAQCVVNCQRNTRLCPTGFVCGGLPYRNRCVPSEESEEVPEETTPEDEPNDEPSPTKRSFFCLIFPRFC